MNESFDVIVIGSGPGGYPAAIRAAQNGARVALIEEKEVGGTCLNRGCIPSKALISCAEAYHFIKNSKDLGIETGPISFDFEKMVARKDQVVNRVRTGLEGLIKANKITLFKGFAKFITKNEIDVSGTRLQAKTVIISSGSEPKRIPAFPCDGKVVHDSTSLLDLKILPKKLVVIGGGVIGCEFASLFRLLGVEVTIIEMLPRILSTECLDLSKALTKQLNQLAITIHTDAAVEQIHVVGHEATISFNNGKTLKADAVLVAVGRSVNSDRIGLKEAGLVPEKNGALYVNNRMETKIPGIYAIGDVTGKWWLAHVATHQGIIAANNATGKEARFHEEAIPSVVFTHPELASVGMSPEKATEKGYTISVGRFPFHALGKAQASGYPEGFAQVVIDSKTHQILGAQVIGHEASTLIAEMAVAIANELTVECLTETIHAHPTLSEVWLEAALMAQDEPLHMPRK